MKFLPQVALLSKKLARLVLLVLILLTIGLPSCSIYTVKNQAQTTSSEPPPISGWTLTIVSL